MTLILTGQMRMDAAQAKAELASASTAVQKLGTETERSTQKSKASAAAATAEAAARRQAAQAAQGLTTANRQAAGATGNLVAQFNDIGMMMAAGQNPLQLAIQQGTQITQVIGPMGAAGAAKALGSAFVGMLNPISLGTMAIIGITSAAVNWASAADDAEEKTLTLAEASELAATAVEAYSSAADLAIVPIDKLIERYGRLAGAVREARVQQAELARADAGRAVEDLLTGTGFNVGDATGLRALAAVKQDFRAPSEEMQKLADLAGGVQFEVSEIARQYKLSTDQALGLAIAAARVRDSAALGATEQVAATTALRDQLVGIYGSADAANQATGGLVKALNAAVAAAADVAAIDMAAPMAAASTAATTLAARAQAVVDAIASADGSNLVGAFQSAFPVASQLLGMAQGIIATIGGARAAMDAQDKLDQMAIEFSPGGQNQLNYGSRTPGGSTSQNLLATRNTPKSLDGSGGGAGAARDEASALQELITGLEAEIEALRVQDPIQQEMLKHREALAGATDAERQKVEDLIAAREREAALMEGAKARAEFFEQIGTQALDALINKGESFNDVLKNIISSLLQAIAQAALFGTGPFGSLFGGTSIFSAIMPAAKAEGGMVHGPGTGTSDSIPTMLSNGEYVVNARATARNRHLLEAINTGGRVGFAEGGYVGSDNRRSGAWGGNANLPGMIYFDLRGSNGDQAIEDKVRKGAAQMIGLYDREGLAVSMQRVSGDPKRRG